MFYNYLFAKSSFVDCLYMKKTLSKGCDNMSNGFDKLANGVGKAIETVPDIYDDALKPTIQESGNLLALIPRGVKAALVPYRQWIAKREYQLAETEKLLAQKLEHVNDDKIIIPDTYVSIPAIQAISYTMDSEELRNLYARLLSKAMNIDTKDLVHPSFIEIIKQLSPLDAKAIDCIGYLSDYQPLIRIFACNEQPIQDKRMAKHNMPEFGNATLKKPLFSHYSLPIIEIETTAKERTFIIQNLNRLGLINIDYRECIIEAEQYKPLYDQLKSDPLYQGFIEECKKDGLFLQLTVGYTSPTDFGKLFFSVCCEEII